MQPNTTCGLCARFGTNATGGPTEHAPDCPTRHGQGTALDQALRAWALEALRSIEAFEEEVVNAKNQGTPRYVSERRHTLRVIRAMRDKAIEAGLLEVLPEIHDEGETLCVNPSLEAPQCD